MNRVASMILATSLMLPLTASAVVIDFEGFVPDGDLVNVNPVEPYTADGFTLTPTNNGSAVFDSARAQMIGNASAWFGFAPDNLITLTGGGEFGLASALIGPSSFGARIIDMTIVGQLSGGGTISSNLAGLMTATHVMFGWTGLTSVTFRTTADAGLDNLVLSVPVPEPSAFALLGLGLAGLGVSRRRKGT